MTSPAPPSGSAQSRWPLTLHLTSIAGCVAFWAYLDRHLWFFGDEWEFLVARGAFYWPGDPRSVWYPHIGHWSTLPILAWRALYNIFHLGSYWPYLALLLAAVAAVLHLLWRVCTRNALSPAVSLALVTLAGLLGPGAEDLGWAFQVGFMGSLAFGLCATFLADGSRFGKREKILASSCALASLMCSTLGDAMVVALAIVLFSRRPAKEAAAVLTLPVASYAIWWAALGHRGLGEGGAHISWSSVTALPGYVWTGLSATFGRSFNLEEAGSALLLGLLGWAIWELPRLFREKPAVLGLAGGALVFFVLVGLGRSAAGDAGATAPRYIFAGFALGVPLMACALGELRPSLARGAVVALLLFTALGDAGQAQSWTANRTALVRSLATQVRASAQLLSHGVVDVEGPSAAPIGYAPSLTASALARIGAARLLGPAPLSPASLLEARELLQVGVTQKPEFPGKFSASPMNRTREVRRGHGCRQFVAPWGSPALVLLVPPHSVQPASVQLLPTVDVGGSRTISSPFQRVEVQASLVEAAGSGPASPPVAISLAPEGRSYLDDSAPGLGLRLEWAASGPLTLCGLSAAPA